MSDDVIDEPAKSFMALAARMLRDGFDRPAVCCTMITVAVSIAEAAGGKHEAIQYLRELLGDLSTTN